MMSFLDDQVAAEPISVDDADNCGLGRGCLLAGPGRGDCLHYVGLYPVEDETTTDVYGRPLGWCEVCWKIEQLARLTRSFVQAATAYGGPDYAEDKLRRAMSTPSLSGDMRDQMREEL